MLTKKKIDYRTCVTDLVSNGRDLDLHTISMSAALLLACAAAMSLISFSTSTRSFSLSRSLSIDNNSVNTWLGKLNYNVMYVLFRPYKHTSIQLKFVGVNNWCSFYIRNCKQIHALYSSKTRMCTWTELQPETCCQVPALAFYPAQPRVVPKAQQTQYTNNSI